MISGESEIIIDHFVLLQLKIQQLDKAEPRPEDYYEIYESLSNQLNRCKDQLVEQLFADNYLRVAEKIKF